LRNKVKLKKSSSVQYRDIKGLDFISLKYFSVDLMHK